MGGLEVIENLQHLLGGSLYIVVARDGVSASFSHGPGTLGIGE